MACVLTTGFALPCKTESPGIKSIWLVEWDAQATLTVASGEVTAHTLDGGKAYFKYAAEAEKISSVWRTIPNTENGSVFYEADVVAELFGVTTAMRNEIKLLAKTRMLLLALDNEGNTWMYGINHGVKLQQSETNFGKAFGDFKGTILNFMHKENDLPALVQSSVVTSLSLP